MHWLQVVYAIERENKYMLGSSSGCAMVNADNARLTAMDTNDDLVSATAALFNESDWTMNSMVWQQYEVVTRDFSDGFGLDWIIVIASPIKCDVDQYFRDGNCNTCPFLMSVNPDPTTSTDVPCVCEKDTFAIGSEAYAYW